MLAEHIGNGWDTLALFCDVNIDNELIKQWDNDVDAAYRILKKWNQSYTGPNPQKELVEHLQKMSLPLVARHFEQGTLLYYKPTSNKRFS